MSNRKFSWNILSWLFFWKCEVCLSMDRSVIYVQLRIFINGSIFSPSLLEPMVLLPQQQPEIRNIPRSPRSKVINTEFRKIQTLPDLGWYKKLFSAMTTWGKTFIIMSTRAASLYSFQASAFFAICSASAWEKLGNKKKKRKISPQPTATTTT